MLGTLSSAVFSSAASVRDMVLGTADAASTTDATNDSDAAEGEARVDVARAADGDGGAVLGRPECIGHATHPRPSMRPCCAPQADALLLGTCHPHRRMHMPLLHHQRPTVRVRLPHHHRQRTSRLGPLSPRRTACQGHQTCGARHQKRPLRAFPCIVGAATSLEYSISVQHNQCVWSESEPTRIHHLRLDPKCRISKSAAVRSTCGLLMTLCLCISRTALRNLTHAAKVGVPVGEIERCAGDAIEHGRIHARPNMPAAELASDASAGAVPALPLPFWPRTNSAGAQ